MDGLSSLPSGNSGGRTRVESYATEVLRMQHDAEKLQGFHDLRLISAAKQVSDSSATSRRPSPDPHVGQRVDVRG